MPTCADDLVMKNRMQRRLGQITGTCFQRCTGLDTLSVLHSLTWDIDEKHGTGYHQRHLDFLKRAQRHNVLIAAGRTDPKGDRSKRPFEQSDPDMFLHVSGRNDDGIFVRGVKAHMTGGWNQHWICVMPTMNLGEHDRDYAVVGMIPGDAAGITYIYGRQASDTRSMEGGDIDQANAPAGGHDDPAQQGTAQQRTALGNTAQFIGVELPGTRAVGRIVGFHGAGRKVLPQEMDVVLRIHIDAQVALGKVPCIRFYVEVGPPTADVGHVVHLVRPAEEDPHVGLVIAVQRNGRADLGP